MNTPNVGPANAISVAPIPRFDDRFARQNRYAPPPEFPLASCYSGIVHHLSGPNIHAQTQIFLQSIMIGRWCGPTPKGKPSHLSDRSHLYFHYAPRVCHPNARTHVSQYITNPDAKPPSININTQGIQAKIIA